MIDKILDRMMVMAGISEDENSEIEIEESRGLSEENFKALTPTQQIKYIKEHPTSKYGKDPKWLRRAKMLKTKMMNMKKARLGNKSVKAVTPTKKPAKPAKPISKPISKSNPKSSSNRYGNYPYITDPKEIKKLMPKGVKYTVNKDGTVDVQNSIENFDNLIDEKGHFKIKFGKVDGDFSCKKCNNLTSLEGAPEKVGGNFWCWDCKNLKSLEGAPKEVGEGFSCANCRITSLECAPKKVGGDFNCCFCSSLTSLKGAPKEVGGRFSCEFCNITSLEGAPEKVKSFNCMICKKLTSLEGAPKYVHENFDCSRCPKLTSLKGAPKEVGGKFDCIRCNNLKSLEGAPEKVGIFDCRACSKLTSLEGAPEKVGKIYTIKLKPQAIKKYGVNKVNKY